ncbi:unnamed protein product, partial [Sphacelaria rigidula]
MCCYRDQLRESSTPKPLPPSPIHGVLRCPTVMRPRQQHRKRPRPALSKHASTSASSVTLVLLNLLARSLPHCRSIQTFSTSSSTSSSFSSLFTCGGCAVYAFSPPLPRTSTRQLSRTFGINRRLFPPDHDCQVRRRGYDTVSPRPPPRRRGRVTSETTTAAP